MDASIQKAIIDFVDVPKEIISLANLANHDLYFGPLYEEDTDGLYYPGFVKACQEIQQWARNNVSTLYVECDANFVTESEPQGEWVSPVDVDLEGDDSESVYIDPPDYYEYEYSDVLAVLFGSELVHYIK